jgi:hypothetical protein
MSQEQKVSSFCADYHVIRTKIYTLVVSFGKLEEHLLSFFKICNVVLHTSSFALSSLKAKIIYKLKVIHTCPNRYYE